MAKKQINVNFANCSFLLAFDRYNLKLFSFKAKCVLPIWSNSTLTSWPNLCSHSTKMLMLVVWLHSWLMQDYGNDRCCSMVNSCQYRSIAPVVITIMNTNNYMGWFCSFTSDRCFWWQSHFCITVLTKIIMDFRLSEF